MPISPTTITLKSPLAAAEDNGTHILATESDALKYFSKKEIDKLKIRRLRSLVVEDAKKFWNAVKPVVDLLEHLPVDVNEQENQEIGDIKEKLKGIVKMKSNPTLPPSPSGNCPFNGKGGEGFASSQRKESNSRHSAFSRVEQYAFQFPHLSEAASFENLEATPSEGSGIRGLTTVEPRGWQCCGSVVDILLP